MSVNRRYVSTSLSDRDASRHLLITLNRRYTPDFGASILVSKSFGDSDVSESLAAGIETCDGRPDDKEGST